MKCQNCGKEVKSLGGHWYRSSCPRPPLTDKQHQIVIGGLLGDGNIQLASNSKYPRFRFTNTKRGMVEWLSDEFGIISSNIDESKAAYQFRTRNLPDFNEYLEWYSSGEKIVPDIELTPLSAKVWYYGDGTLEWGKNPIVEFVAKSQLDNIDNLIESIKDCGFSAYLYDDQDGRIRVKEVQEFLDWMGDPIPCMKYKWITSSRSEYRIEKNHKKANSLLQL